MKKYNMYSILKLLIIVVILAIIYYSYLATKEYFSDSGFKWISDGTCASHNMRDLSQSDCSNYLQSSNYTVTGADHGPPGCWLVFGDSLTGAVKGNPQLAGKGFGCYSQNKTDGKQCSADFPCVCK